MFSWLLLKMVSLHLFGIEIRASSWKDWITWIVLPEKLILFAYTAYGKGVRLCLRVFMCVHLQLRACAYNAISSGRWRCGTKQPGKMRREKRRRRENESHYPLSSLRIVTRREGNQPRTCRESLLPQLFISPFSPPSLFLRIRYHAHSFLHMLLIYLASQEAQQVITGMWANSKQAPMGHCGKMLFLAVCQFTQY